MKRCGSLAMIPLSMMLASSSAHAHPGSHTHMASLWELIAHYAELDHLAFLAATLIVGVLAYRAGRRTEARVHAKRQGAPHDPR